MPRPYKLNETPTSPFSLRETGPLAESAVSKRLNGRTYRTAPGKVADTRATVDPTPCPACGSLVEWALTAQRDPAGAPIRYVYARCRAHPDTHRWGLRSHTGVALRGAEVIHHALHPTPPTQAQREAIPPPRPSAGAEIMASWIESRIQALAVEMEKLKQIKTLASEIAPRGIPPPRPSQDGKH